LDCSGAILAGGPSRRTRSDKALLSLGGRPLIRHVYDAISETVDEVIAVVDAKERIKAYSSLLPRARFVLDKRSVRTPLVGALAAFEASRSGCTMLLACDTPFVSADLASLMIGLAKKHEAVVPRWPNGYLEPLQAVYRTQKGLMAADSALAEGKLNLASMIPRLQNVLYLSTLVIQQIDPRLDTFFNVNTEQDLREAEGRLRAKARGFP
jgi:molybdopterin-guanine dinucleotide biosynthesis protein A